MEDNIMENLNLEKVEMTEDEIISKLMEEAPIPEAIYIIDRLGIQVTLKGLSEKEINRVKKECTYERKVRGNKVKELDEEEFNTALIEKATVKPNWNKRSEVCSCSKARSKNGMASSKPPIIL